MHYRQTLSIIARAGAQSWTFPCFCHTMTFESLDAESSFLYAGSSSENAGQVRISRSSAKGQDHRSKNSVSVCPVLTISFEFLDLQT